MVVPTLLLTGSEGPLEYRKSINRLASMLPGSTIHVLQGQGHAANIGAPSLLAAEIIGFVSPRNPDAPQGREGP
ncbi:MAG: hypothetical protein KatS3mg049_0757 [Caldilinea sp.]|uniref:Alpha/beta hydrolase n=1 Tax=Caldilinea aerophila (strain DSM 14535 / JCM 11387 / NBRC 104270 / STL-6-O1) TaxID=926550 RepID=I0I6H1_CALAS|nr:hypothetical protein CLDAP_28190 [Caldilinea aerophila DSM 14535 = NBRC 104270]GIV72201.1 MAG: hypothetical protein KatS3mg049_0757 [Caldilinea sp.]